MWDGTCLQQGLCYLLLLLSCVSQGIQVSVGVQLRLHGADALLQGAELSSDFTLQLLHLLQVLLQTLRLWMVKVDKRRKLFGMMFTVAIFYCAVCVCVTNLLSVPWQCSLIGSPLSLC